MVDRPTDLPEPVPDLIIDTSIYRADPDRRSVGFRVIERLASNNKIRLHVPYFVAEELRTYQHGLYEAGLRDVTKGLKGLQRKRMPPEGQQALREAERIASSLSAALSTYANHELNNWWSMTNAVMHQVGAGHGGRVAARYFAGTLPFKTIKHRDDFPDAFILETAIDIHKRAFALAMVTDDTRVAQACKERGIEAFGTLGEYLNSGIVEDLYEELEETQANELLSHLPEASSTLAAGLARQVTDRIVGSETELVGLPLAMERAYVESIDADSDDLKLGTSDAEYLGEGLYTVPFSWNPLAELSVTVPRSRLHEIPEASIDEFSFSEHTDLAVTAAFSRQLEIRGTLSFDVGDSLGGRQLDKAALGQLAARASTELASVEIEA